ncbi:DUF6191 domain-containing protein [Rhodococcus sp. NPDC003348]
MTAVVWVLVLVAGAVFLDRVALWAERRGWIYWRKRKPEVDGGAITGAFGEIQSVLSPSHRHVVDEQRTQKSLRHDAATGDDTGVRVDLDGGTVRFDG